MDAKDYFESDGIRYRPATRSFVERIFRPNRTHAQFTIDEKANENFGKFIKQSAISRISFGSRNPQKITMGIVTFNVPTEGLSYKMVYDESLYSTTHQPIKVFVSSEEGRWKRLQNPSEKILDRFETERKKLNNQMYDNEAVEKDSPPIGSIPESRLR